MGKRSEVSGAALRRIFILLIICVHLATTAAETLPFPPANSCPNHLSSTDEISCTPLDAAPPPPPHDCGDLLPVPDMMGDQELSTATLTVLALLAATKEDRTELEIFFILIVPSAVFALVFCEIPLRNRYPRFAEIMERLVVIFFVNGVMALRLPAKFLWVPTVCFGVSLLTLIISPCLP